jgi:hypothetical protein
MFHTWLLFVHIRSYRFSFVLQILLWQLQRTPKFCWCIRLIASFYWTGRDCDCVSDCGAWEHCIHWPFLLNQPSRHDVLFHRVDTSCRSSRTDSFIWHCFFFSAAFATMFPLKYSTSLQLPPTARLTAVTSIRRMDTIGGFRGHWLQQPHEHTSRCHCARMFVICMALTSLLVFQSACNKRHESLTVCRQQQKPTSETET